MNGIGIRKYGGLEVLEELHLPTPDLSDDEILIEVKAAAINPVDWKIREGYLQKAIPYQLPLILGWDVAGIVKEVGASVDAFKAGDKVYSRPDINLNGSYADEIVVKKHLVSHMPKNIGFAEAASIPLVGITAWQALIDYANLKEGQKVLIHAGSGGIGTIAIQLAKSIGAFVATTTSTNNIEFVKGLGADCVIDYNSTDFSMILKEYDVVFDTLGGEILLNSYKILKPGGNLVTIFGSPDMEIPQSELAIHKKIKTSYVFTDPNSRQLDILTQYIESNKIKPVVSRCFPLTLEGVKEGHLLSHTERVKGKLVLLRD